MGSPTSLLQGARAFARDYARDAMPRGYLWDVVDYIPEIIDAPLTGRGAWRWGSPVLDGDVETGTIASFPSGEQLLAQTSAGTLWNVSQAAPFTAATNRGPIRRGIQNPIQADDNLVIAFDAAGANVPQTISDTAVGTLDTTAPHASVGTIWQNFLAFGGVAGSFSDTVYFQAPTLYASAWDPKAFQPTTGKITGLAALRSVLLVFHTGTVERIRGSSVPRATVQGDLTTEPLFQHVGCPDPKAIAFWNENVIFADEHGIHITDGAVTRNLAQQGGISTYWRPLYQNRIGLSACVFLDFYMITIRRSDGLGTTLVCDLNKRQWYRFSNIAAVDYISSSGSTGMERVWAGIQGTSRLARIGPVFFPDPSQPVQTDDNGTAVLPTLETPYYTLAPEGRKRIRFAYLSYDARFDSTLADAHARAWSSPLEAEELGPPAAVPQAVTPILELSYIRSPQLGTYTSIGQLPPSSERERKRLPVNQFSYGIAFKLRQLQSSSVTRIFDLAVEAQAAERSRV